MDYQVVWSEPARSDLEERITFLAERSPRAAERLLAAINKQVNLLASQPLLGSVYGGDHRGTSRQIICKKHRVFYRVDESREVVEILAVWHGSRREPHLPT
jgi:plasmid stabilization system protein ParE